MFLKSANKTHVLVGDLAKSIVFFFCFALLCEKLESIVGRSISMSFLAI
jgi:hypothetical protein